LMMKCLVGNKSYRIVATLPVARGANNPV